METTNYNSRRRHQTPSPSPPSSRLVRSRSGSAATTRPRSRTTSPGSASLSSSQRFGSVRSNSTTKSRPYHNNNHNNKATSPQLISAYNSSSIIAPITPNNSSSQSFVAKLLPRRPAASAWALSPARSLQLGPDGGAGPTRAKSSGSSGGGGGGVGGVLNYFRQVKKKKKASGAEEEEFHRLRVLQNAAVQWRFVNAKAHVSFAATNRNAQNKLFSVWIRIFMMRNSMVEKRIQIQRLKCEIKVYEILNPQILLLNQWAKLEKKNQESLGKLVMKLTAVSLTLPLIHGAKVTDVMSMYEAISEALIAMDGIEQVIARFYQQVERILYMVTELLITYKQYKENLEQLEKSVTCAATLVENETSLRTHCIQAVLESTRSPP